MQENKVESQGLNMSSITNKQVGRFVKSESSLVFKWLQIVKVLKKIHRAEDRKEGQDICLDLSTKLTPRNHHISVMLNI